MSLPKTTKAIILNEPPIREITPSTFKFETRPIPELEDGQVLLKTLAISNDPAQRGWIDGSRDPVTITLIGEGKQADRVQKRLYVPPVAKGAIMRAGIIGEVIASKSEKYKEGERLKALGGWAEYGIHDDSSIRGPATQIKGHSEWISLGYLGSTGQTAYSGIYGECDLRKEHTVVVSGAAGATGSVFLQIAKKVIGCEKVIGIAGGKEKCDWVKSLGADACIDYKDANFAENLAAALPDYCDVYFDNVGGEILDQMLALVKRFGRIVVCGAISGYHGQPTQFTNWFNVVSNSITIKGFIYFNNTEVLKTAVQDLTKWVEDGTISVAEAETVVDTVFEDIPKTWQRLFQGQNRGKLVTKLIQ